MGLTEGYLRDQQVVNTANFLTFWSGFVIFVTCCMIGFVMSFFGGGFIDTIHGISGDLPGHDSDFATETQGDVFWFENLYFFLMYAIPVGGAVVWGQSIIKKGGNSSYQQGRF